MRRESAGMTRIVTDQKMSFFDGVSVKPMDKSKILFG